jgi:subtilisin family serine protease
VKKTISAALLVLPLLSCDQLPCPPFCPVPPPEAYDCDNPPQLQGLVKVEDPTGRYIVVLKPEVLEERRGILAAAGADPAQALQFAAAGFGTASNIQTLDLVGGFSADLSSVESVVADPRVQYVQEEGTVRTQDVKSWGLDRIDQRVRPLDGFFEPGALGAGVHLYIQDTGVIPNPEFADRLSSDCFSTILFGGCADDPQGTGHGTHVAGTAAGSSFGVCRGCTIHSVRFLNKSGSGTDTDAIRSLGWIAEHDPGPGAVGKVVNASWGGSASPAIDDAVCKVIAAGATFVAAAGNSDEDAKGHSPARVVQALTTCASTRGDEEAYFSNYGDVVDLCAPGTGIDSIGGRKDGTSMASPHVAGVAALTLARNPVLTPAGVAEEVFRLSTKDVLSGLTGETPNRLVYARGE